MVRFIIPDSPEDPIDEGIVIPVTPENKDEDEN